MLPSLWHGRLRLHALDASDEACLCRRLPLLLGKPRAKHDWWAARRGELDVHPHIWQRRAARRVIRRLRAHGALYFAVWNVLGRSPRQRGVLCYEEAGRDARRVHRLAAIANGRSG